MRALLFLVAYLIMTVGTASAQDVRPRFALLIGNKAYAKEIGPLKNPHNDVGVVGDALKNLGFKVETVTDADLGTMLREIGKFAERVRSAGDNAVGLFYYSGHGAAAQDTGVNYLIPVDVKSGEDSDLWASSLRQSYVIDTIKQGAPNATHFFVFDACRNELKVTKKGSQKNLDDKGFRPLNESKGILIAYATAPGETASDVGNKAGPYARAVRRGAGEAQRGGGGAVPAGADPRQGGDRAGPLAFVPRAARDLFRRRDEKRLGRSRQRPVGRRRTQAQRGLQEGAGGRRRQRSACSPRRGRVRAGRARTTSRSTRHGLRRWRPAPSRRPIAGCSRSTRATGR